MDFKEQLKRDIDEEFLNLNEFAGRYTVEYDGGLYYDTPLIIEETQELIESAMNTSNPRINTNVQGLYFVRTVVYCKPFRISTGQVVPEKGTRIKISDNGFMREYEVKASAIDEGMARLELEDIDE
jgi:hypothetical protein